MLYKMAWPLSNSEENPFGGIEGFRFLRITLHDTSFANLDDDEKRALENIEGLARANQIDTYQFRAENFPRIVFDIENENEGYINLRIVDRDGELLSDHLGVHSSWLENNRIISFMPYLSSDNYDLFVQIKQELLEVYAHQNLERDIFVTGSSFLLKNKDEFPDINISKPSIALKIIGLYLRMRYEKEWIFKVRGNVRYTTSQESFYLLLAKGKLSESWKYLSALSLSSSSIPAKLGFTIIDRCAKALRARDEIARLSLMPPTFGTRDKKSYHFDYLSLLLSAAFDVEALIINDLYALQLNKMDCGLTRKDFRKALIREKKSSILEVLDSKDKILKIIFGLRNKIHTTSIEENFILPENYDDELFDSIYDYHSDKNLGIEKKKIQYRKNNNPVVPAYEVKVDFFKMADLILEEGFDIVNALMQKTDPKSLVDATLITEIKNEPPTNMQEIIAQYKLLY